MHVRLCCSREFALLCHALDAVTRHAMPWPSNVPQGITTSTTAGNVTPARPLGIVLVLDEPSIPCTATYQAQLLGEHYIASCLAYWNPCSTHEIMAQAMRLQSSVQTNIPQAHDHLPSDTLMEIHRYCTAQTAAVRREGPWQCVPSLNQSCLITEPSNVLLTHSVRCSAHCRSPWRETHHKSGSSRAVPSYSNHNSANRWHSYVAAMHGALCAGACGHSCQHR